MPDFGFEGYLYVIAEAENAPAKVWISFNPSVRAVSIRSTTGLRRAKVMRQWYASRMARDLEIAIHRKFADYRMSGEWFDMPAGDAIVYIDGFVRFIGIEALARQYDAAIAERRGAVASQIAQAIAKGVKRIPTMSQIHGGERYEVV